MYACEYCHYLNVSLYTCTHITKYLCLCCWYFVYIKDYVVLRCDNKICTVGLLVRVYAYYTQFRGFGRLKI